MKNKKVSNYKTKRRLRGEKKIKEVTSSVSMTALEQNEID